MNIANIEPENKCSAVKLIRLSLENFKGVNRFELAPEGRDIRVLGDNASGKTSLADAFSWLLFGKDSQGRADFDIKTLDAAGKAIPGLEHAVAAVLDVDGKRTELRKVYRELWTKKRGSLVKEFTGNTKDTFVDGVPVTQSEYEKRIAGLADEQVFRLLTNPVEFAERLHWQERRRILLEVCGDMSDAEIIASSQDLADLTGILNGRSIDDHRKVVQAQRKKINGEIQKIPVRIDEVYLGLPELGGDKDSLNADRVALGIKRAIAADERSRIEAGGEIAEKTKQLREIEAEILEERNKDRASRDLEAYKLRDSLAHKRAYLDDAQRAVARTEKDIDAAKYDLSILGSRMAALRDDWCAVDARKFSPTIGDDVCAACGQKLPAEAVEHAQSKAKAQFSLDKACRLKDIADEGKKLKRSADELGETVAAWQKELEAAKKVEADLVAPVAKLKDEIANLTSTKDGYHVSKCGSLRTPSDLECEQLAQKAAVEAHIETLREANFGAVDTAKNQIAELDEDIAVVEHALSKIEQRRLGEARIESLKGDERRLAGEFEGLERQLYLLDEFTRRKVSLLTERINSRFELARFKLFNILVNGGLEECCEVTHEGVPWPSLNTGAQVNIGLDVIRTLSQHYGIAPPIFIDHSESVTRLLDTPGQQIRLQVSASDKELRVEEVK